MEDRQPTGLVLECLETDPDARFDAWLLERAAVLAAGGPVTRATPFARLRTDERFPTTVGAIGAVTVCETTLPDPAESLAWVEAQALSPPAGARPLRRLGFRRYPRPSQGRATRHTTGIYLILISPNDDARAQELRDWGDFVHLHHIAAASPEGFTTITPYENVAPGRPRFMHFYELDADDPVKAVDEMPSAVCRRWGFELGDEAFMRWAICEQLSIDHVNVFARVE